MSHQTRREELDAAARLTSVRDASDVSIIGTSPSGVITSWNPESERMYGYSAEQAIGQDISLIVPADQADALKAAGGAAMRGEWTLPLETRRMRADGTVVNVSVVLTPVREMVGPIIGVSAVARDLTESNRTIEALRATEARLSGILASANDAIITSDQEGRVHDFNPAAEQLFGCSRAEVVGRIGIDLFIAPEARAQLVAHMETRQSTGELKSGERIELSAMRADGARFEAEVSINLIDTSDGVPMFVAFIRDLTERNLAEATRLAFEVGKEQSERFRSLGQLAGGVAHDFNNLLIVILNHAAFAAEAAPKDETIQLHMAQVLSASERAVRLTRQLLMFARREPVQVELLDLNAVIENVRSILTSSVGGHIELIVRAGDDRSALWADRGQLEQILLNLVLNARDAMPDGGTLCIEWATTTFEKDTPVAGIGLIAGRYVDLKVSDSGVGMTAEVAARAFEPFFTTKSRSAGSGIGLATVHRIVTAAGGALSLSSVVGQGTTVHILFPAADEAVSRESLAPAVGRRRGCGEKILVVEDDDAVRELTILILRRNGYVATGVATGSEGLALSDEADFDLVLTDVIMPKMSGPELVAKIRVRRPNCPVLYMSGYAQPALKSDHPGPDEVVLVQKPFTESSVLKAVGDAIHTKSDEAIR